MNNYEKFFGSPEIVAEWAGFMEDKCSCLPRRFYPLLCCDCEYLGRKVDGEVIPKEQQIKKTIEWLKEEADD